MRDLLLLTIHLLATLAKILRPGGVRSVAAESLLLKHRLLISNRSGGTPAHRAGTSCAPNASLDQYAWRQHCRGLFQIPIAALVRIRHRQVQAPDCGVQ